MVFLILSDAYRYVQYFQSRRTYTYIQVKYLAYVL